MYYTLPQFLSNSFIKFSNYYHVYLQVEPKMFIKISLILRSQLILFYTVTKQDISIVYHGKGLTN